MADSKKAGMISGMAPLAVITGDELMEVSSRQSDGTWKTFSILINKIRTNQGLSAYEVAVVNGFQGTQAEWLESLKGQSAYAVAVELGFVGTEEEWLASLVGPSAYQSAVDNGYEGTETEWLATLKGLSAYQIALVNGFVGTESAWLQSLVGKSAYQIAKEIDPTVGTEAEWLATLVGASAYQVAVENGFVGSESAWLASLEGSSAYQIWVAQGNIGTEADFLESLKGEPGDQGLSAYEVWLQLPGNAGKTEEEFFDSLKGEPGEGMTQAKLQELLDLGYYTTAGKFSVLGDNSGLVSNAGFHNFMLLFDKRLNNEDNSAPNKVPQRLVEMSRMEAEGYSYWKNDSAPTDDPAGALPAVPNSEIRLYDSGAFQIGSLTDYIEFGDNSKVTVVAGGTSTTYDLSEATQGHDGKSAYEVAVDNGFVGTEAEWLLSLKGTNGQSAYQIWLSLGNEGTEQDFIDSLKGEGMTRAKLQELLDDGSYTVGKAIRTLDPDGGVITNAGFLNFLFLFDKRLGNANNSSPAKVPQRSLEMGRMEAEGYSYWKNEPASTNDPSGKLPEVPNSEVRLFDNGLFQMGSLTDYIEFGDAAKVTVVTPGSSVTYDLSQATQGEDGKSAYEVAVENGFDGTEAQWLLSLRGATGGSAYEVAVDQGFIGTEAEWLASLKGADGQSAYQIAVENGFPGSESAWLQSLKGTNGTNGDNGENGLSAYEVWLTLPGNAGKTEAEYIESLKGEDGTNGTNGDNGQSAYELWLEQPGNAGKTEAEFLESLEGLSAYQTWLTLPGNAGKSEADFIASLAGEDGEQGLSAYQVWVNAGNVGNEAAFIASLKGAPGTNGTNGTNGEDGTGVNILATVSQEDFDDIVAEGGSAVGDGYIVTEFMYIYNGTDWVKSNSLVGPEGKGLNYLGVWPTGVALPLDENYNAGDTYVWGATAGNSSLWTLVEQPTRAWVDIGVPGPVGKSAYQTWLDLPGNAGKTEAEFIASLKGEEGEQGEDGLSAYQIWLAEPGNSGTEADFIASLKGETGEQGAPAIAFEIKGQLANESELPRPGVATEAYYVGKNLYVWIAEQDDYENLGSLNGESAYQVAVDNGFVGTEVEWLASLKGTDGTNGTNGTDGRNLQVLGRLANQAAIEAVLDPAEQDAYIADDTDDLWIFSDGAWFNAGQFGGEDGTNGTNGKSAYELWLEQPGNAGKTEEEFLESLKGQDGTNGADLDLRGTKADATEIQAIVGPVKQEAWVADDTGHLWIYNGTDWVDVGEFRGADGTDGTNGTNGLSAYQVWLNQPGNAGKTEAEYIASLKGANGLSITAKGFVANQAALAGIASPAVNDAYTTTDTGHLYVYSGTGWVDFGELRGAPGQVGPRGQGINIVAEFATLAERPPASDYSEGDAVYILEDHKLYQVNAAGLYNVGIHIQGEQGPIGPDGPEGAPGTSITIMGSYANEAALIAAHPTGNPGEGYLIGSDLWLYGVNPTGGATEWYNVGPVRGPQGPIGPDGPRGLRGLIGPNGVRGSLWLVLPEGTDTPTGSFGQVGDWAVNSNFDSFYKDDTGTWNLIGRLVAGDVNSPLPSAGKVVREGTEWVPLPVDAVPSPVQGKQYVMLGGAGGTVAWAEISIPASGIPEVPNGTVVPQGRTSAGWTAVMAVPTGHTAGRHYDLVNGAWTQAAVQIAPSTTDVPLCYKVTAAGVASWEPVTFDAYSLKQDTAKQTANFSPTMINQQTFRVDGVGAASIQVTLPNFTTGRTLLAVFVVEGNLRKMTFAAASGASVAYNNNVAAADIEYGATQTIITAFWNGFGTWIISKGPAY